MDTWGTTPASVESVLNMLRCSEFVLENLLANKALVNNTADCSYLVDVACPAKVVEDMLFVKKCLITNAALIFVFSPPLIELLALISSRCRGRQCIGHQLGSDLCHVNPSEVFCNKWLPEDPEQFIIKIVKKDFAILDFTKCFYVVQELVSPWGGSITSGDDVPIAGARKIQVFFTSALSEKSADELMIFLWVQGNDLHPL